MSRSTNLCALGLFVVASVLVACGGGGSPTGPSGPDNALPPGTVLAFLSGETDQPVAGASVTVLATPYTADSFGAVTLTERAPLGATVTVTAGGFLERRTVIRSLEERRFALWPSSSRTGLSAAITEQLVYTHGTNCCTAPSHVGEDRLKRVSPSISAFSLTLDPAFHSKPAVKTARDGASIANRATLGRVTFFYTDAPTNPKVTITIDPTIGNAYAVARRSYNSSGYITGGTVAFRLVSYLETRTNTMAHELGHMLGLEHSTLPGVMFVASTPGRLVNFSPGEVLAIRLLFQRFPANRYPDDDAALALRGWPREDVVECHFAD